MKRSFNLQGVENHLKLIIFGGRCGLLRQDLAFPEAPLIILFCLSLPSVRTTIGMCCHAQAHVLKASSPAGDAILVSPRSFKRFAQVKKKNKVTEGWDWDLSGPPSFTCSCFLSTRRQLLYHPSDSMRFYPCTWGQTSRLSPQIRDLSEPLFLQAVLEILLPARGYIDITKQ